MGLVGVQETSETLKAPIAAHWGLVWGSTGAHRGLGVEGSPVEASPIYSMIMFRSKDPDGQLLCFCWVTVKEVSLSYQNMDLW